MTFEEQLTRAFETLTERLRGDIDREVQRASAALAAAAPSDGERALSDVNATTDEMEIIVAAARQEAHEEGFAAGREEGRRELEHATAGLVSDDADATRLASAVRAIARARSLTGILDALVTAARTGAGDASVWLVRGGRLHQWRSAASHEAGAEAAPARLLDEHSAIADAARTDAPVSADGTLAVPIAIAGQVVAVLVVDAGEPRTVHVEGRLSNVELLTRYAARSLEALTAFTIARGLTQPSAGPNTAAVTAPEQGDAAIEEEDASARRYARLLVSEIRLYHESAVVDGRRDRDLAARLGGEIARARVMYEQRVPPHVRLRANHFHDELVRTLADGDASLLELRSGN